MAKNDPIEKLLINLGEANADTLAALDNRIEAKEQEIDGATEKLRKELGSLLQLRKVIAVIVNGPKVRKVKARKPKEEAEERDDDDGSPAETPAMEELRNKIHDFLSRQKHPMPLAAIAKHVALHHIKVMHAMKHPWFEARDGGYTVAVA